MSLLTFALYEHQHVVQHSKICYALHIMDVLLGRMSPARRDLRHRHAIGNEGSDKFVVMWPLAAPIGFV